MSGDIVIALVVMVVGGVVAGVYSAIDSTGTQTYQISSDEDEVSGDDV